MERGAYARGHHVQRLRRARTIGDVAQAERVAHHVERHSARDWWEDPASFTKNAKAGEPVGFLIDRGGKRLDPSGGLFVYTVPKTGGGPLYFAVTETSPDGRESRTLEPGSNTLREGITAQPGPIEPIWQQADPSPAPGAGKGKALWLHLHAKGGVWPNMEYLAFGDETMGWRPGLPFKFSVRLERGEVVVRPTDRVWINRPHLEAADGGMPAIWTFWYGYSSTIYDRAQMKAGNVRPTSPNAATSGFSTGSTGCTGPTAPDGIARGARWEDAAPSRSACGTPSYLPPCMRACRS